MFFGNCSILNDGNTATGCTVEYVCYLNHLHGIRDKNGRKEYDPHRIIWQFIVLPQPILDGVGGTCKQIGIANKIKRDSRSCPSHVRKIRTIIVKS